MLLKYVKRGAYNTFFYSLGSIIARGVSYIFLPYFAAILSLTELGVWGFYQTFFSIGSLLFSSCASTAMIRFYLMHQEDPIKQEEALGNAFILALICALTFPLFCFLFFLISHKIFNYYPLVTPYLYLTIVNVPLYVLFSLCIAFIRLKENFWHYLLVFCGQSILTTLITFLGVVHGYGIISFFYATSLSLIIFAPFFFYILYHHHQYSLELFKQQMIYSFPLLLTSFIYMGFLSLDKIMIKYINGYDTLGTYSLLWRFGIIFQFFSMALVDAWPIVLYNAQKEESSHLIIARLIDYFCIALTSVCLIAIIIARCAISIAFPYKYYFLINYLPLFFLPLIFLEIARLFNAGFGLSQKTTYTIITSLITLVLQAGLLWNFITFGLWGIFIGNAIAFVCYMLINYFLSSRVYPHKIINLKKKPHVSPVF